MECSSQCVSGGIGGFGEATSTVSASHGRQLIGAFRLIGIWVHTLFLEGKPLSVSGKDSLTWRGRQQSASAPWSQGLAAHGCTAPAKTSAAAVETRIHTVWEREEWGGEKGVRDGQKSKVTNRTFWKDSSRAHSGACVPNLSIIHDVMMRCCPCSGYDWLVLMP